MYLKHGITTLLSVTLALLLGVSIVAGQTKQLLTYRASLDAIQKLPAGELEDQKDTVAQIRTGVEFWLRLHPNTALKLDAAPPQPWNSEQILKEAKILRELVDAIIKEDRVQSFELGVTEVSVTAEVSPISPITDSIDRTEISGLHATNVTESVLYLPGVAVDYKAGRNQTGIMIRGFDTRQIGVYLDGVPVYVPYDGYADLGRFLTNDLAVVELAKGYSSPLLGPNGLGGTINLVSRQPEKKIEGDLSIGTGSGRMLQSGAHFGSKLDKFLIRGGMDWLETDYFPLSGNYKLNSSQPTYNRLNSDKRDVQYNGRFGYTPKNQDQYIFTYIKQKAENNVPSYAGVDTKNNKVRYWMYPYWNRDSYYFNSNTGLGEASSIQFRAFYDQYPNGVIQFANQAHSSMQWFTAYDDYSAGLSSEFLTKTVSRHALSASFFLKDDTHKSQDVNVSKSGAISTEPWTLVRDRLVSLGFQDVMSLSSKFRATVGFSMDYLNGVEAQDLDPNNIVIPFQCTKGTVTGPCVLPSEWAFNPLASVSYSVADSGTLFFTFALKSHFPTLKDRYSSKMGKAVPSPDLEAEHARNYSLGYSHALANNTMMQVEVFRSDVYDAIGKTNIPEENPDQCTGTTCEKSINVGKELHKGFEFTVRSNPLRRLNLTANYTFLQRTISGPADMPPVFPTGTPKHRTVATATVRLPRELVVLASARYESGAFTVNDANWIVPSSRFATMDLGVVLPIYAGASLQVGVKNLFDRNYYYQEGFPEAGRNWYANLRYRF